MWLEMLGLGPVMEQITNPDFQKQLQAFAQAQFDTHARCVRIEAALARTEAMLADLLEATGIAHEPGRNIAAVSAGNRSDGHRVVTVASGAAHDGNGRVAGALGTAGNGSGQGRG
jgi:hypothetical protein